jgi:UDP-glucose 4-epimerase
VKLLITGSAGFIGGSVGRYAASAGHAIVGVARRSQPDPGWPGFHVPADAANTDLAPIVAAAKPDVVFHAAGSASVGSSVSAPWDDFRAAVVSWANLLDGVRRSGRLPLVVFPSSAAVYGNPADLPVLESAPIAPISPYGYHKAACELLAREYADCFGVRVLVVRVFSVFGPAQRRLLVWDLYQQAIADGPDMWLEGTGQESRDYLHVDDLSALILGLAATVQDGAASVTTVNAGRGEETPVLKMAEHVRWAAGRPVKSICCRGYSRPGDPRRWRADTTQLKNHLPNWQPRPLRGQIEGCVRRWMTTANTSEFSNAQDATSESSQDLSTTEQTNKGGVEGVDLG